MAEDDLTSSANTHGTQVAQRQYEHNGQGELTTAIIYAIAEADGVSLSEVKSPPLYDSVDVPAIEKAFFGPNGAGDSRQGVGTVEFQYSDYLVKVQSDGWIRVYEPTEADHS
ncbi:HalOD1 output domain-containing protein [Halosimplex aquaticum]|uniref:Halobacterial output domain-containing protein n=2 Tax=Halobacteriales TaxID=2235 RepID=A0A8U0I262_9EURY|nr:MULTISPECIES: HalOD1 output domain-containing protein [Halobacteriales]UPV76961.1 hypothetical protein M0R89_22165 [Halorussus limi]